LLPVMDTQPRLLVMALSFANVIHFFASCDVSSPPSAGAPPTDQTPILQPANVQDAKQRQIAFLNRIRAPPIPSLRRLIVHFLTSKTNSAWCLIAVWTWKKFQRLCVRC
jgi:hypothetical protein